MATKSDIKKQWYMTSVSETCEAFDVQIKKGLSGEQVRERLKNSKNVTVNLALRAPKISIAFWATASVLLVLSVSVYALESNAAVFIFAFSACLLAGFALMQQGFVKHILHSIAKIPPVQVRVRRNGNVEKIAASNIVLGDVVVFKAGDFVPANVRLLEVKDLLTDEALNSGQNVQEAKNTFALHKQTNTQDHNNMISASSYIISGTGIGIIVSLPLDSLKTTEFKQQKLNKKQLKRSCVKIVAVFVLGMSVIAWRVPVAAAVGLSALLAISTNYYVLFWLQFVTWTSLYDQAAIMGLRFKDIKALKSFYKVDMVFIDAPSDFADIAALIHQLQAELQIEVRPLIKASDVSILEKELNIQDSALTYKDFMDANRSKKIKQLNEYQLLVGFDSVAIAEAVGLMQQVNHHVAWIDDSDVPQTASSIADTYISLANEPTAIIQSKSDIVINKQVSLRKIAAFFDAKTKFKNMTAY